MLPGELQAQYGNDPGYKNFLSWIAAGGKHGSLTSQMVPNEAVVRTAQTPWGESKAYDAAGNDISMYRAIRPGEAAYYTGAGGLSAPEYDPVASRNAYVPWAFTSKGIAGQAQPSYYAAMAAQPQTTPLLSALAQQPQETELERQQRLAREAQLGVA